MSQVTGRIANWELQDRGDVLERGKGLSGVLDAYKPGIVESPKHEKTLKQVYLNRYVFIGEIKAILVRDLDKMKPISAFLKTLDLEGLDTQKDFIAMRKKILDGGYASVLKEAKKQQLSQNTVVDAIIVNCGIPVRLNYGSSDVHLLKKWCWSSPIPNLSSGFYIAGECDMYLTLVDATDISCPVSGVISKVYKKIMDPQDKNFGKIVEVKNSGDPFKLGLNETLVALDVNKIAKLWYDVDGRISEVLT